MTPHQRETPDGGASPFDELMAEVMAAANRFGHREHVHLTWLAVRRFGVPAASGWSVTASSGLPSMPGRHRIPLHGQPRLAGTRRAPHGRIGGEDTFAAFACRHPALLSKRLLMRHYRPATLASPQARTGWVEPDLAPFPWQDTAEPHHTTE